MMNHAGVPVSIALSRVEAQALRWRTVEDIEDGSSCEETEGLVQGTVHPIVILMLVIRRRKDCPLSCFLIEKDG